MENGIVFDLLFAQPVGTSKFHGGGEYIKTVFKALVETCDNVQRINVCYDTERFIDDWILKLIEQKGLQRIHVKTASDIVNFITERAKSSPISFFAGMIYPYSDSKFPDNVTCIGTCHGLRVLEKPYDNYAPYYISNKAEIKELIKYLFFKKRFLRSGRWMYGQALKRFDVLITDSEHSAYSIRVNFPELAQEKQIHVLYTPDKYIEPLETDTSQKQERYLLMISANRWLKNSYRGVMTLDGLYRKGLLKGIKTKVLGNLPERIKKRIKSKECFEFVGYVSTEDLEKAYRDCELFFYPTLNEGFGLPPMEAMKYGKTCVISAVCSLTEVYGDSVYYCNPYDIMEMQGRILNALDKKIDSEKIENRLKVIHDRQKKDLEKLCKMISGSISI